jgi:Uma2 family endonuclease
MVSGTRVTLEEFLARPDIDERRLELIDGEVCEKVAPTFEHGEVVMTLGHLLWEFGRVSAEPRAVIPPSSARSGASPIPDAAFYLASPPGRGRWMERPPDIAFEVLSPGQTARRLRRKLDLYEEFGVTSVWVIDPLRESAAVHERGERREFRGADRIACAVLPQLALTVDELFARSREP